MSCCTDILNLGCKYSCDIIETGITAPATGTYTLVVMPDSIKVTSIEKTIGQQLIFSGGYLNEDAVTIFKILKPDGTYLETADGEDCFQVEIKPTTNPTLANVETSGGGDVVVSNSDDSYSATVDCGDTLELTDVTYNINVNGVTVSTFTHPAQSPTVTINIYPS